ncbi:MAG: hypothetical protein U1F24_00705 [Alphaproteobacteria bacterium]
MARVAFWSSSSPPCPASPSCAALITTDVPCSLLVGGAPRLLRPAAPPPAEGRLIALALGLAVGLAMMSKYRGRLFPSASPSPR